MWLRKSLIQLKDLTLEIGNDIYDNAETGTAFVTCMVLANQLLSMLSSIFVSLISAYLVYKLKRYFGKDQVFFNWVTEKVKRIFKRK